MAIEDDIRELVKTAKVQLREMEKGIIVLEEAGEDVTTRREAYELLKRRIDGLEAGLKKIT